MTWGGRRYSWALTRAISPGVPPAAAAKAAKFGELLPMPPPAQAGRLLRPRPHCPVPAPAQASVLLTIPLKAHPGDP